MAGICTGGEDFGTTAVEFLVNNRNPSCGTLLLSSQPARSKVHATRAGTSHLRAHDATAIALAFMISAETWDGFLLGSCTGPDGGPRRRKQVHPPARWCQQPAATSTV